VPTLAAIFPPTQAPERLGAVAAAAEVSGLSELWVWEDCFCQSGIATATAILAATSHVGVGIGLLPVPLRNVALTAMELATMSRLFPGRLTAGVGHGVADWMSQVGGKVSSPMTLLREYTVALHALLRGETVTSHGRYVHLDGVALDWPPAVMPPLLVGGIGPRTVGLAGEVADGLILPGGLSPDDVRPRWKWPSAAGRLATRPASSSSSASRPTARRRLSRPPSATTPSRGRPTSRSTPAAAAPTSSGSSGFWLWKWLRWCREGPASISRGP
jgi:alkanesulfonate monooxygenase SsuD/methylene tetrahydromethanopterin reductase-like flavin-dependent oxidoreductase (luciferase family)